MSKKRIPAATERLPLLPLSVSVDAPPVPGARALTIVEPFIADVLVNGNLWDAAGRAAELLFHDEHQAYVEHKNTTDAVCRTPKEAELLEASEWAYYQRLIQAAYIIGLGVGQRVGPDGAR